jgi:hypothetical protein
MTQTSRTSTQEKLIYADLTAEFVDFPKLMRSLKRDRHNGYVRLATDQADYVLHLLDGLVTDAVRDAKGEVDRGQEAFNKFGQDVDSGKGHLDVVESDHDAAFSIAVATHNAASIRESEAASSPTSRSASSTKSGTGFLLRIYVVFLPSHTRTRWLEEWRGELAELDSRWARIHFVGSLVLAVPRLARVSRSRFRVK